MLLKILVFLLRPAYTAYIRATERDSNFDMNTSVMIFLFMTRPESKLG